MSDTKEFWAGDFGNEYTNRNRVDWRARIPFWDRIMQITGIRSAFEVGCNAGWNLSAIKHANHGYNVYSEGCEINYTAAFQANAAGVNVRHGDLNTCDINNEFELVFTAGVLIHTPPDEIVSLMRAIIDASCDYVLAIEYEAKREEEVEYRGHAGKLWKRPYGNMYELMGLTLAVTGKMGKEDGFDPNGVTYWLFRK